MDAEAGPAGCTIVRDMVKGVFHWIYMRSAWHAFFGWVHHMARLEKKMLFVSEGWLQKESSI